MTLRLPILALLGTFMLASCDAVRVPGVERPEEPESPVAADPPSQVPSQAPNTPPASDPGAPAAPADPGTDTADTDPEPPAAAPIYDLAEINAVTCGLPETAEPTPTLAQLNKAAAAELGPQPESLLQTQVVGVSMAVSSLDLFPGIVKIEPVNYDVLGNESRGHCGATRIADRWFLTAAHCIDEGYDEIRFIAGAVNVRDTENASIFKAESAICHAGYGGLDTGMINDIALIKVSEDTLPTIRNVPIASYGEPDETFSPDNYSTPIMAGWGSTSYGSTPSEVLLSTEVRLVSASPSVILVESVDGRGPCQGDSGGPLYVTEEDRQQRVVGVLSNVQSARGSTPCAGTYRGQYTNVGGYADWIDNVIRACEDNPLLCRN
jgi:hypothetical protein